MSPQEARKILDEADLLCSAEKSALAVRRVAAEITARLADANPLVLAVMGGAVVFTGQLLPQLASRWISITCMSRATAMSPAAASWHGWSSRDCPSRGVSCWWWMTSSTRA
jgi:hypoxanthine-guanine phosphoribosyltransferase